MDIAENDAPERVWVQVIHGRPVLYDLDPREVHDNGKPVYVYAHVEPDTRRDVALQKLDVMFRTWFPARLQEEVRSLVNGLIVTRASLAAPDAAQNLAAIAIENLIKAWYWKDEDKQIADALHQAAIRVQDGIDIATPDAVRQAQQGTWKQATAIAEAKKQEARNRYHNGNDYASVDELNGMIRAAEEIAAALRAEGEKE